MSYFVHDMDHDGEITSKDAAMFHEMMDEDLSDSDKVLSMFHTNCYSWKEILIRIAIALGCCVFADKTLDGTLPCNLFTMGLGIVCGIASLLIVLDLVGVDL